jgi:hypothetical protein
MLPAATVCHAVPGRLRVRVPGMRGDEAWFRTICADVSRRPEFAVVSGNERTGTILLKGRDLEPEGLATLAREAGWFDLDVGGPAVAASNPDRSLATMMLVLALVQAMRGKVMVPAIGFVWYALELLRWEKPHGG